MQAGHINYFRFEVRGDPLALGPPSSGLLAGPLLWSRLHVEIGRQRIERHYRRHFFHDRRRLISRCSDDLCRRRFDPPRYSMISNTGRGTRPYRGLLKVPVSSFTTAQRQGAPCGRCGSRFLVRQSRCARRPCRSRRCSPDGLWIDQVQIAGVFPGIEAPNFPTCHCA